MYGPEFVWILNPDAGTVEDWVREAERENTRKKNKTDDTCTKEQFEVAVNRTFILSESNLRKDVNTTTASGLVRKIAQCNSSLSQ